jgi:hypothetical protein
VDLISVLTSGSNRGLLDQQYGRGNMTSNFTACLSSFSTCYFTSTLTRDSIRNFDHDLTSGLTSIMPDTFMIDTRQFSPAYCLAGMLKARMLREKEKGRERVCCAQKPVV